ncbi:ncs1 nucleoside transporter family protein [Ophiostoma piceae UAMH 11346]|uniref:Ncs1 nucleoside transporter family protein n=1 Tax=Ophiostoma piceae (strain UAMH 11346) TaxID=1262450 RepID=S3BV48_OPHP1|nr:ncs1 nucleoside transporter family protein [Ophiostoma piceae UAMH 11346]
MPSFLRKIDDFVRIKDESDGRPVDRWKSPDILPVPPKNRNFGAGDYVSYWVSGAVCASFWAMGSTTISNGLAAAQAIGAMFVGSMACAIVAHLCGEPGIKYQLRFPIMSRATFGMYGSYFVVIVKCFTNPLYCGIQAYWGGLTVHVMFGAIFPSFHHMKNTLPATAHIMTADLIGVCGFMVVFYGVLIIKPYRMNIFFRVSLVAVIVTIITMFIWAISNVVASGKNLSGAETFFVFIQTGINYSERCRAGTFFGGLGWFLSQLAVNVCRNSVPAGMDLTSVAPRYLNARRGSLMVATIGLARVPVELCQLCVWLHDSAQLLWPVVSPLIGMYTADFWVVRRLNWNVPDLFVGDSSSAYYYKRDANILGFIVWPAVVSISLPGFSMAISGDKLGPSWKRIFQITIFVGMFGSFIMFSIGSYFFPPGRVCPQGVRLVH